MKLNVYVLEARDLLVKESKGVFVDAYVKLQVGKYKSRTRVLKKTQNPIWNEEFDFRVVDMDEELIVSVVHKDDSGFFSVSRDLVGRVRIPIWSMVSEDNQTLPPTWFSLENPKAEKSGVKDSGKILLSLSLHGGSSSPSNDPLFPAHIKHKVVPAEGKHLVKSIGSRLGRLFNKNEEDSKSDSRTDDSSEVSCTASDYEDCVDEPFSCCNFEEAIKLMQSSDNEHELPQDLEGGILVDQTYKVSSIDLNSFLFMPDSQFRKDLAELQGTTDLQEGPWTWKSGEGSSLTRVVSYIKAATKLVKAVKATEEQTYVKANGREFAVMVTVCTPDVPYGNCFKIELLYRIIPGIELSSGEESARLIISWKVNFYQSTMMRGMIEGGARQGLKESFEQFADLLGKVIKPVDSAEQMDKEQMLASLQMEHQPDWQLAIEYFWNFTVLSTIVMGLYITLHILLSCFGTHRSLEFGGLDLPDTFGELFVSGVLFLQLERVFYMISHFIQARLHRGNDHGVRSQGDGWVLTVALVEGSNIASMDAAGLSDPYVVLSCNGKTRTSSVKLQTCDPQWNEILEFDATEEPPAVLDVEVFDFDGPFDQAASLGHAEVNFLKHTSTELADIWVPLEGKLAQASQSKLHLRIFLDNNNGIETIREYLTKMEKEVGTKLNLRSPHRNSTFQKLFGLPPEEFLINDFSCYLKRKMPLQGRLFLSARIVGFYANLFGHKTKFFFLWEDIEDVEVIPPSLASVGSPSLVITLRKGRGFDAKHGAKSQDEDGRLRFHFQSFVSFNVVSRTIMALWRTRTLNPEIKGKMEEDQQDQDERYAQIEDSGPFLGLEDANMLKIYSVELPLKIKSLLEMFDGGELEHKVMGKSGCLNYTTTAWEVVRPDVFERHLSYKFNRNVSIFGGEVTSTQQKSRIVDGKGWIVDEVMILHDVPFGDHFRVHVRYQIETPTAMSTSPSHCQIYLGIAWLKSTKFQERMVRNITDKFTERLKEIFELAEREILFAGERETFA
ncbi:C2 and gram domain-containing protein [Thalictrum thalictroides]|uniref:C2 and gram domain-containing protein n=1 Tax=Thalictrum thalictroides TaxID=46969 RepID=A0A7J6VE17_THATH|nr:C2 and gram domain-containing protein [Thalictrum thalictroides]